ncbi:uncharacterized protein PHACADRAFT_193266 [Phanerochaete carnosa HHB-10118-sp]|uniref:Uncharacterized protein n=1 Tax=Phanerochaete carnosa (strain HHB-10118-sp) TaxID=650164 RepID=K5WGB5_PHACS|nr:uncharacterized protein PHACADRAFT_193266 [Phanerochaete carnosa HHB-10118-sp]EKM58144.1 hypothetical protein PHACADRAFT_193266 [Phanerochaete carnosa HHB-10118-sp]
MISCKIWAGRKGLPGPAVAGIRIRGFASVVIESAATYPFILVAVLVTSGMRTSGLWIILDSMSPITGMIFSAVVVRVSKEYHTDTFTKGGLFLPALSQAAQSHPDHRQAEAINLECPSASSQMLVPGRNRGSREFSITASPAESLAMITFDKNSSTPSLGEEGIS